MGLLGPAIDFNKFTKVAPDLTGRYQSAQVSLGRHCLMGQRAAVYLVIDHSGSMRPYFKDGSVQDLAERILALAAHLDDDGIVPVVFFDTIARTPVEISLGHHVGAIEQIRKGLGRMGQTNYAAAMRAVIDHYQTSGASVPALVIFQTDGSPTSRKEATQIICDSSHMPIFWQFIGFGDDEFSFLRKLDTLPAPTYRLVDNAGFFPAGMRPTEVADTTLYDYLLSEFPQWLVSAQKAGILPRPGPRSVT